MALILAIPGCRKVTAAPVQNIHGQNFLLITIEKIRANRIGCHGHKAARTPALDAIAARGAAEQTQSHNPFVLKTLAEAHAETGDLEGAAAPAQ